MNYLFKKILHAFLSSLLVSFHLFFLVIFVEYGGLGLSNEMIRNRNPIYAYEAVWISTRADLKEKVEFEEETPKIFYKWK